MQITIDLKNIYREQMEVRYALPALSYMRGSNAVVDSFYPTLLVNGLDNKEAISSSTACAISPVVAKELNVPQIHISELCSLLHYKKKDIKKILTEVKSKKKKIHMLGMGGTGSNFVYFVEELCRWTNTINIFNEIFISDNDTFDITNIPRIPFNMYGSTSTSKSAVALDNIKLISRNIHCKTSKMYISNFISAEKDTIFYGAPDIETREIIFDYNADETNIDKINFVSATHGGDKFLLQTIPEQNESLQVESYGLIDLSIFFMNQLKMSISFLEEITKDTDFSITAELKEYSFRDEIDNKTFGSTSKVLNFLSPKQELVVRTTEEQTVPDETEPVSEATAEEPLPELEIS